MITTLYLTARYTRRLEMREVADKLRRIGYLVISTWHDSDVPVEEADKQGGAEAERDFEQIKEADAMIFFNKDCRIGSNREVGAAQMIGKLIFGLPGPSVHPFDHYRIEWCLDLDDVIQRMKNHDAKRG